MRLRSPHNREALVLLALAAAAVIWVLAHVALANGNEPNRVELYECGAAVGLHDGKPGYRIVQHAHYTEAEDGSGTLWCGNVRMVIVGVPW